MKAKDRPKLNGGVLQRRRQNGENLFKYEEDYLLKFLIKKADTVFSKFIRKRDKKCITEELESCQHRIDHNAHRIERGWYSHRRDENNCNGCCNSCNCFHEGEHKVLYTVKQTKKFGQERVDEQLRNRNKKKPTIQELIDIINKYSITKI